MQTSLWVSRRTVLSVSRLSHRGFFNWRTKDPEKRASQDTSTKTLLLREDDLFHPLSTSPFKQLAERGKRIRTYAPCPVCIKRHDIRRNVQHECENCGYPTHCSAEH